MSNNYFSIELKVDNHKFLINSSGSITRIIPNKSTFECPRIFFDEIENINHITYKPVISEFNSYPYLKALKKFNKLRMFL